MRWMMLPGNVVSVEIEIGLLILFLVFTLAAIGATFNIGYHLGKKEAPARTQHLMGGLEGQCAAKDQVIADQQKRIIRQAEVIGAVRGFRKHVRAAGA